jgi:hypothetical protein
MGGGRSRAGSNTSQESLDKNFASIRAEIERSGADLDAEAKKEIEIMAQKQFTEGGAPGESTIQFIQKTIKDSLDRKGSVGEAFGRRQDYLAMVKTRQEAPGITAQTGTAARRRSLLTSRIG